MALFPLKQALCRRGRFTISVFGRKWPHAFIVNAENLRERHVFLTCLVSGVCVCMCMCMCVCVCVCVCVSHSTQFKAQSENVVRKADGPGSDAPVVELAPSSGDALSPVPELSPPLVSPTEKSKLPSLSPPTGGGGNTSSSTLSPLGILSILDRNASMMKQGVSEAGTLEALHPKKLKPSTLNPKALHSKKLKPKP